MDEACLPVPSTKKACFTSNFFLSPARCPKSTGGDEGQNVDAPWFGGQLQPLIAINLFFVFNAQQGSRGTAPHPVGYLLKRNAIPVV
jgi:hypothetical protein